MPPPPLRNHLHTNHLNPPPIRKSSTIISPRHTPLLVVVNEFAEDASEGLVSEGAEVDAGFGVAFACEDAAGAGAEGDEMAGAREVVGGDCWGGEGACG